MNLKTALLFINILSCFELIAQPSQRFIKYYNLPPHYGSYSYDVTTTNFGYILSGITIDTINGYGYNKLTLLALDNLGDSLWTKSYGAPNFQYAHDFSSKWMLNNGSNLFLACTVVKPANEQTIVLIKFNMAGDSLWQKEYTDVQQLAFEGFNSTPEKGFIFTGYVADSTNRSLLLLKTDSLGNELWRKKINTASFSITGMHVVCDSTSKKHIVVGYHNPPPTYDTRSLIIVTDSLGNKLNQFSYNSPYGGSLFYVIKSHDNNFIACGANSTGELIGFYTKVRAQIVKFGINGNLIWSKEYGEAGMLNQHFILYELPNHEIVIGGEYDTLYNDSTGLDGNFLIRKIDPNGENIWARTINLTIPSVNIDCFTSMDTTQDGGVAITGYITGGQAPNKYILVKLDSLGCDTSECQYLSIDEPVLDEIIDVIIFPNPSNSEIEINSKSHKKIKEIRLYDIMGDMIKEVNNINLPAMVQLSGLSAGTYFVKIFFENGHFLTKRIIIY
jgi:hypothetical protein